MITITLTREEELKLSVALARQSDSLLSEKTLQGKAMSDTLIDILKKLPTPTYYNWKEVN